MSVPSRLLGLGVVLALAPNAAEAATARTATEPEVRPEFDDSESPVPEQRPGQRPELVEGATPSSSEALTSAAGDCDPRRYCAWTGGYFTGPVINFYSGASYNWGNYSQSACTSSGISGAIWKNCASSVRNRNGNYTSRFYVLPNGTGLGFALVGLSSRSQLGAYNNNIDSSTSSLI